MRYDGIVVTNIVIPSFCINDTEHGFILQTRICKKSPRGYIDLETNSCYSVKQQIGIDRVDKRSMVPLTEYYNCLGFKKNNGYENKEEVYQKVRRLKHDRKI